MKRYRIQQEEMSNGTLPYPYFIDENGMVGRQDFWKGNPSRLLGFSSKPVVGDMDIRCFLKEPLTPESMKAGVGNYPVFSNEDGEWVTHYDKIEYVEEIE